MLRSSADKSGRVLTNPGMSVAPHIEFIEEVCATMASLSENSEEEKLESLKNYVRLFALGVPNRKGEPTPGPQKV